MERNNMDFNVELGKGSMGSENAENRADFSVSAKKDFCLASFMSTDYEKGVVNVCRMRLGREEMERLRGTLALVLERMS